MEILCQCPGNLATGGTEGIHNLVRELDKHTPTKVWYIGGSMPEQFKEYNCDFVKDMPIDFNGVVIFPEVWANKVVNPMFANCITVVNWQGVDVYNWAVAESERGIFLQNPDTIHIANSQYATQYLRGLGIEPVRIPDCLNDVFYHQYEDTFNRVDEVLYNPVQVKMTLFQQQVMAKATTQLGIRFKPLEGYTTNEIIDTFRHSKLYIDFGVFSGRERLPREAVMCGCCILTSNKGTAGYYSDNTIPKEYKLTDVDSAVEMIRHILTNYDNCKHSFDEYREALKTDRKLYPIQVRRLYDTLLSYYTRVQC